MSKNQNWTWDEYNTIYKGYINDRQSVYSKLSDRTVETIDTKAARLDVNHDATLREDEQMLLQEYGSILGTAMLFLLPDRTVFEVKDALLCLRK